MTLNRTIFRSSIVRGLLVAALMMTFSAASFGQIAVGISVRIGPPALPVYAQPVAPGPGYLWTPGYWAWNDDGGYYWVPGTWVVAPVGLLWTPGYWGWNAGFYGWHAGYWGPHIGFYGGINYGFGYGGVGFVGGEWRGGAFYYNRSVTNVSVTNVTNVYNKTVVVNNTTTTSFNGGTGGVQAQPTPEERAAMNEPHTAPLAAQTQQEHLASQNKQNFASANGGKPAIAATSKAGDFSAKSAVPARSSGGEYHAPTMSPKEARAGAPAGNNGENKPSTAEKPSNSTPAAQADRPANSTPANESHSSNTQNNSKPAPQSKPAAQPKSKPAQQPKHSNPPKNEHKGR